MSNLEHLIPFRARFTPKRTDDLKPGALALVGQVKTWEPGWVIGEDDSSVPDYWGQWACFLVSEDDERHGFSWTPECDLTPIHGCVGGHEFTAPLATNIPEGAALDPERITCNCGATSMTVTAQHNPGPPPIEAVVVASRAHTMTFAGTCLNCGQDARQGHCTPTAGLGVPFGLPRMVVAGEVDPGDSRDN